MALKTTQNQLNKLIKILKKAIAEKCIDCVCFQPHEVLKCEVDTCSLFKLKPKRLTGLYSIARRLRRKYNNSRG